MPATIAEIQEAVARAQDARKRVLQHRSTDAIVNALAQAANNWLAPGSPWRARVVAEAPAPTGFSPAMVNEAVDLTFGILTPDALAEVVDRELQDRQAFGPPLIAHFLSGNVPPPGIVSICCGLLVRSANLVRVSSRDPVFPKLFVESLREVDADLAGSVAVLDWPKEHVELTRAAMASANAVIAYGNDATIEELRRLAPTRAKFFGFGHRLSFAVVSKEAMTRENLPALAEAAAFDASVYDQQGCLSPHVFYVEEGGEVGPREFAAGLAEAMAAYQAKVPRGKLSPEEAALALQTRQAYEFRAASDHRVSVWAGHDWTVIYEDNPAFTVSCLNRTVFVKAADGWPGVLDHVRRWAGKISTVGLAPWNEQTMARAAELTRLGVHRVCAIGQMQRPPLSWHHDGRPNLADLVRWTDAG